MLDKKKEKKHNFCAFYCEPWKKKDKNMCTIYRQHVSVTQSSEEGSRSKIEDPPTHLPKALHKGYTGYESNTPMNQIQQYIWKSVIEANVFSSSMQL